MIEAKIGDSELRATGNPELPQIGVTRVTVSIDVLTQCAHQCFTHLVAAATEFGERPVGPIADVAENPPPWPDQAKVAEVDPELEDSIESYERVFGEKP